MKPVNIKFGGIEAGRGLAALAVVMHHAGNNLAEPRFYDTVVLGGHLGNFNVGVDFFFVLSGFIIAWIHQEDIGRPSRLKRYALRRILRIYPPYWLILLPLSALYFLTPGSGKQSQHEVTNLLFSLTLLPYTSPPIIGAAWTLVHEVLFYFIFGFLIVLGRRAIWILPVWAIMILLLQLDAPLTFPWSVLFNAFNLEFLIGVAGALFVKVHNIPYPRAVAFAGGVAFIGFMLFATSIQDQTLIARMAFGLSALAALLGLVQIEKDGQLAVPKPLLFLGSASYAIYLIHGFALSIALHLTTRLLPKGIPPLAILFLVVTFAVLIGCLFHYFVERPVAVSLRSIAAHESRKPAPV